MLLSQIFDFFVQIAACRSQLLLWPDYWPLQSISTIRVKQLIALLTALGSSNLWIRSEASWAALFQRTLASYWYLVLAVQFALCFRRCHRATASSTCSFLAWASQSSTVLCLLLQSTDYSTAGTHHPLVLLQSAVACPSFWPVTFE